MRESERLVQRRGRLVWGVGLLGFGIGGFFDGIVLHQVLQWHHMLSNVVSPATLAGLELNVVADGLFHAVTYIATLLGVALTWGAVRHTHTPWSWLVPIGGILVGWGIFNLAEGIVDHHVLQVHHVRSGQYQLVWDLGFLAWGAVMLVIGAWILRTGIRRIRQQPPRAT